MLADHDTLSEPRLLACTPLTRRTRVPGAAGHSYMGTESCQRTCRCRPPLHEQPGVSRMNCIAVRIWQREQHCLTCEHAVHLLQAHRPQIPAHQSIASETLPGW